MRRRQRDPLGARLRYQWLPLAGAARAQPIGQRRDGRCVEDRAQRDIDTERGAQLPGGAGSRQRVAAQFEETVEGPHALDPQHRCAHLGDGLLDGIARGDVFRQGRAEHRFGQRGAVDLAHRRQRQRIEHQHRLRNHMRRQPLRGIREQLRRIDIAVRGHQVGGQPRTVRTGDAHHVRDRHRGMRGEHGFDLAEFDALTADLHLEIGAAEVFQRPVGCPARQVPGAVHPGPGRTIGCGHERGRRGGRPFQIAAGQLDTGDEELPGHPDRNRPQFRIQYHGFDTADRPADRDTVAHRQRIADRDHDRGLGRAVSVEQFAAGRPQCDRLRGYRLAAGHQHPQRRQIRRRHGGQHGRRHECVRDPLHPDQFRQFGTGEDIRWRDDKSCAVRMRHQQFQYDRVETGCRQLQYP
ncbi:hypothetical protein GCM10011588_62710 [Nocardia jinanensis]|uniref:Uncharacterized protein n=1 Tax=Nocardia jinanensis TaxID=382504 RepID=A0A917RW72_9NOCA|nr:hypothetical protein GCM10011588_62710 [Nocardia jinanensis]